MKQEEIWFITSKTSPIPPKSIQQKEYTIDCNEMPLLTDYRITKCTRLPLSASSINTDKEKDIPTVQQTVLSEQLTALNKNIEELNRSIQAFSIAESNVYSTIPNFSNPGPSKEPIQTTTHSSHKEVQPSINTKLKFYLSKDVAEPGETIDLHISSPSPTVDLRLFQNQHKVQCYSKRFST